MSSSISIELLPGDGSEWLADAESVHAPFLFLDRNLGVSHKAAYKAYLEAVPRFRGARQRLLHSSQPLSQRDIAEAASSSSVLLLINPAHQSALNARKRLVELGSLDAAHELRFTNALLTLREGAKQSNLWQHRRWLLRHIHPSTMHQLPFPSKGDGVDSLHGVALPADTFRAEFAVVEKACEVYPRNYHAWAHRFLCAQSLVSLVRDDSGGCPPGSDSFMEVLKEEIANIRLWIERHVSDYSAMQYYLQLADLLLSDPPLSPKLQLTSTRDSVEQHAMELVCAYPTHEALWLYLRWSLWFAPSHLPHSSVPGSGKAAAEALTEGYLSLGGGSDCTVRRHAAWFAAWVIHKVSHVHMSTLPRS